jgi:hypothetical protein
MILKATSISGSDLAVLFFLLILFYSGSRGSAPCVICLDTASWSRGAATVSLLMQRSTKTGWWHLVRTVGLALRGVRSRAPSREGTTDGTSGGRGTGREVV